MSTRLKKVVLTEHLDSEPAEWLSERVKLVRQSHEDPGALAHELKEAGGLVVRTYTRVDAAMLKLAPRLQVVGRAGVGLDNIDLEACRKRGVRVVYTPDANTQAVVEYVWALIFDALRPREALHGYVPPPTFHAMRQRNAGPQVNELVLGVLGMGRIGRRVAEVAHAFGMRVIYNDLLTHDELKLPENVPSQFVDKATLWKQSDVLTIHVDGRKENDQLISGKVFKALKPSCLLINAARGNLVDNAALRLWAEAHLNAGARAVLDVHQPEPPPDDYELFGVPNVRLLPHLASRTTTAMANMSWVVRDVVRVLQGQEPQWPAA